MSKRVNISFKENEGDMYEFLINKISPSYFLKTLIKKEMDAEKRKNAEKKPTQVNE